MIFTHRQPSRLFLLLLYAYLIVPLAGNRVEAGEPLKQLPTLEQALERALSRTIPHLPSQGDLVMLEVKRNYDLILARREQLEISREVQGHFEKAVTQAEKKFEEGEGDISQSAITKLKLGLTGTLNDIVRFESDTALAKLRLEQYLGIQWAGDVDISGPKFRPADFPYKTVEEYLKKKSSSSKPGKMKKTDRAGLFERRAAMVEVNLTREKLVLGRKSRKMTRALLVTEVANYDFGIGNESDLFEALIIYTRVLVGYYDTIYDFNLAVHRFMKIDSER